MVETQKTINEWILSTFGEAGSNISVAARANQEMAELIMKLAVDDNDREAIEEVADVVIVLYRIVHRFDADLAEQINRKMRINRGRTWNVANGHGYHVKDGSTRKNTEVASAGAGWLAEQLREAYEKVKEWPENSDTGFMDLLALRNLVPAAVYSLNSHTSLVEENERLRKALEERWKSIAEADRSIVHERHFPSVDLTLRNSERYWVRDADGRVYEASWTEDGKGRNYWWDWDVESPVDPVEFMPHPLAALSKEESQ